MARYNEILVGRYNRFLQKLLQMKGGPPAAQLAGDIQVQIPTFSGAENRYLEGWGLYGTAVALAATVGQTGAVLLRNPATSNVIAVVEKIAVNCGLSQELDLSVGTAAADLTTGFTNFARDSRANPASALSSSSSVASPANLAGIILRHVTLSNNLSTDMILEESQHLVVLPGQGVQITQTVANNTLVVSIWWRERFLEESERT